MAHTLALIGLPLLFLADYAAIVAWLLKSPGQTSRVLRFSLRSLLVSITLIAIHLGTISAFLAK